MDMTIVLLLLYEQNSVIQYTSDKFNNQLFVYIM